MSINLSALAQAIDTTWGRSSTPVSHTYSVKFNFQGEDLVASYNVIMNFVSEKEMILMKRQCAEESIKIIDAHVKHIKDVYKDLAGETLKIKEKKDTSTDSLEIISFNVHNPKRTAYYRRKVSFELI